MLIRCVLVVCLAMRCVESQDDFFKNYAYTKVMSQCMGEAVYYGYLQKVATAKRECSQDSFPPSIQQPSVFPAVTPLPFNTQGTRHPQQSPFLPQQGGGGGFLSPQGPTTRPQQVFRTVPFFSNQPGLAFGPRIPLRQKRGSPFVGRSEILDAMSKVEKIVGNLTCILRKLDVVESNLNINYDALAANAFNLPSDVNLRNDLVEAINYCKEMTSCLPLEKFRSAVPNELQRIINFLKCEKEMRLKACLKHDLRQKVNQFDLSILPNTVNGVDNVDMLVSILIGAESSSELELL